MSTSWRFAPAGLLASLAVVLLGCSETVVVRVGTGSASFAKPEGCNQSVCDVQYDRCQASRRPSSSSSGSGSACSECWRVCGGAVLDVPSCPSTCQSICDSETARAGSSSGSSSGASSYDPCASSLEACRATSANLGCADGVDPSSVPYPLEGWIPMAPPLPPHRGVCEAGELDAFVSCARGRSCDSRLSPQCRECLNTPSTAEAWGAWVIYDASVEMNIAGCVANQGDMACATKIHAAAECTRLACHGIDVTCLELAIASSCKTEIEESTACEKELKKKPAFAACMDRSRGFPGVLAHFCGK